ncbi:MAG: rod-binding protein [Firmicutes bacterium]|nr:rod-binding protein [Bacillota bacterium]
MDFDLNPLSLDLLTKLNFQTDQGSLSPRGAFAELLAKVQQEGVGESPDGQPMDDARLKEACCQLEAVFLNILAKEMRKTVPRDGYFQPSRARELFTEMLDEALTEEAGKAQGTQLAEILYEQLKQAQSNKDHPQK